MRSGDANANWRRARAALAHLLGAPAHERGAPWRDRLELLCEAMFEVAVAERASLLEMVSVLGAVGLPAASAYRALARLALAGAGEPSFDLLCAQAKATLETAPPRTAWVGSMEVARQLWCRNRGASAWDTARARAIPTTQLAANAGALARSGVVLLLRLAASQGAWNDHERLAQIATALWPLPDSTGVELRLWMADHDLMRGRYQSALSRLQEVEALAGDEIRLALLTIRLQALLAAYAPGGSLAMARAIVETRRELLRERARRSSWAGLLPKRERRLLLLRGQQLLARTEERLRRRGVAGSSLPDRYREACRIGSMAERREELLRLLTECTRSLERCVPERSLESWLNLRLLWCRIAVDAGLAEHALLGTQLEQIAERARELGLLPLVMQALDLRAVVTARAPNGSWSESLRDAAFASQIAVEIVRTNSSLAGFSRSLLRGLLPVIDRSLQLTVEGGARVAMRRPEVLRHGAGFGHDLRVGASPAVSYYHFGQAVFDYVEQAQQLALAHAQLAYDGEPGSAALLEPGASIPASLLPSLQASLPAREAVLQYFVVDRYLVTIVFGREFFDWQATPLVDEHATERGSEHLERRVISLAPTGGVNRDLGGADPDLPGDGVELMRELAQLVLPARQLDILRRRQVQGLRLVPHGALYRWPLDALIAFAAGGRPFAVSHAPTATLACEAATVPIGPRSLALLCGKELPALVAERDAIARALRGPPRLAQVVAIDGRPEPEQLQSRTLLHLAAHGRPRVGKQPAFIDFDPADRRARLSVGEVSRLPLDGCKLAVLTSCWSGWLEHRREQPVQGFPQAFRDAGVSAVIAPLAPLTDALAPLFSGVLYRVLRFLPGARALQHTLAVLQLHARKLAARDPEMLQALDEVGGFEAFHFRYCGAPDVQLHVSRIAVLLGWLAFGVWLAHARLRARFAPLTARAG